MSILIKGMEMPKDGAYWCEIGVAGEIATITIHGEDRKSFRLIPIPPHGRLIDGDALMEILSKVIDINASIEQRNEATDQERRCLWWFEQQIGIAPTIIPADKDGEA